MQALDLDELVPSTLWLIGNWPEWVYRRVESIDFIDERRLRRRVSVDFELPEHATCIETSSAGLSYAIPLGMFRKGALRRFDVSDETDRSLPLLARAQTAEVGARLLVSLAIVALQEAMYDRDLDPTVAIALRELAVSFDRKDGVRILSDFLNAETSLLLAEADVRYKCARELVTHATSPEDSSLLSAIYSRGMADERVTRALAKAVGFGLRTLPSVGPSEVRIAIARRRGMPESEIQRALLAMDRNVGPLMRDLARSYLLFVQVTGVKGTRRLIKYAYEDEEGVNLVIRLWSALITLLAGFGLHRVNVPLPNLAAGGSFHIEVSTHSELFCSKAWLRVLPPRRRSTAPRWFRTELDDPSSGASADGTQLPLLRSAEAVDAKIKSESRPETTDGPGPLIHLYSGQAQPGSAGSLRINLTLDPSGLLPAGAFIAGLIFLLLLSAIRLRAVGASRNGETAAAVIIAAAGLFAGYLFRPGEHRLVRRFLRELRVDTSLITVMSFCAAGLLAINWAHRRDAWILVTVATFIVLARRVSAWVVAEAIRRNIHPLEWIGSMFGTLWRGLRAGVRAWRDGLARRRLVAFVPALLVVEILIAGGSRLLLDQPADRSQVFVFLVFVTSVAIAIAISQSRHWPPQQEIGGVLVTLVVASVPTTVIAGLLGVGSVGLMWVFVSETEMTLGCLLTIALATAARA